MKIKMMLSMMLMLLGLSACHAVLRNPNAPGAIAECDVAEKSDDERADCYRERARMAESLIADNVAKAKDPAPATPPPVQTPPPPPVEPQPKSDAPKATSAKTARSEAPEVPVTMRRVAQPVNGNPRSGCLEAYNFAVLNHTNKFQEFRATASLPCGHGNLVKMSVAQGNSGSRPANVIAPGQTGYYYFDPDVGGVGSQVFTLVAYEASPLNGSPEYPLRAINRCFSHEVNMPGGARFQWVTVREGDLRSCRP